MKKARERQIINGEWYTKPKRGKARKLEYCNNTLTESEFLGLFNSALRDYSLKWPPREEAWKRVRKQVNEGRIKYKGPCAICKGMFCKDDIEMDHIDGVGNINEFIKQFARRMLPEVDGWQPLCKPCHRAKTNRERKGEE